MAYLAEIEQSNKTQFFSHFIFMVWSESQQTLLIVNPSVYVHVSREDIRDMNLCDVVAQWCPRGRIPDVINFLPTERMQLELKSTANKINDDTGAGFEVNNNFPIPSEPVAPPQTDLLVFLFVGTGEPFSQDYVLAAQFLTLLAAIVRAHISPQVIVALLLDNGFSRALPHPINRELTGYQSFKRLPAPQSLWASHARVARNPAHHAPRWACLRDAPHSDFARRKHARKRPNDLVEPGIFVERIVPRLSAKMLGHLPAAVARPNFVPAALSTGILHLGCGSFHRAHQALATQQAINETSDRRWGIVAVAMNSPKLVAALRRQDNLYTTLLHDSHAVQVEVVGSIAAVVHAPSDSIGVPQRMASPQIKIVTLTVTPSGYCVSPVTGRLDADDALLLNDLQHPQRPITSIGMIARGLELVRRRGGSPPVVMSCDNLGANGRTLGNAVIDFAALCGNDALSQWIAGNVQFPSSVADRIVQPTTAADLALARTWLGGIEDEAPVSAEPFMNWTIEDFDGERPLWECAGARFVSDVKAYELGKLRLLNGTHMLLAYLGALAGHRTIAEASSDPLIGALARQFMITEQGCTLALSPAELRRTVDGLMQRFRNPSIRHDMTRVGRNGSDKMTPRVLDAMCENLRAGRPTPAAILLIASWIRWFVTHRNTNAVMELIDPCQDTLSELAAATQHDPHRLAQAFLDRGDIFGVLPDRGGVHQQLACALTELADEDVDVVVRRRLLTEFDWSAA